jgi:hypothetical protein
VPEPPHLAVIVASSIRFLNAERRAVKYLMALVEGRRPTLYRRRCLIADCPSSSRTSRKAGGFGGWRSVLFVRHRDAHRDAHFVAGTVSQSFEFHYLCVSCCGRPRVALSIADEGQGGGRYRENRSSHPAPFSQHHCVQSPECRPCSPCYLP